MAEELNIDTLDDEAFMNQFESGLETLEEEVNSATEETENSEENDSSESQNEEVEASTGEGQAEQESVNEEGSEDQSKPTDTSDDNVTEEATISETDQLQAIYAPFKANGVDISVKTPQEAIRLMQQGAGASKRMQDLAPKLKIIQMLENNDLLDEGKINQLIALGSKDPKAIAAYLKQEEIDPFSLDLDEEGYQPQDYSVSDKEFQLRQTIQEMADQPMFQETLDTADTWDQTSQNLAMETPTILTTINSHMQSGIYDTIKAHVEEEMVKGTIARTTPFLEAYNYIGNQLQEAGVFDQNNQTTVNEQTSNTDNTATTNNKVNDKKLNERRKAASSTKSMGDTKTTSNTKDSDLFKMSDDDFMKQFASEEWMNPI